MLRRSMTRRSFVGLLASLAAAAVAACSGPEVRRSAAGARRPTTAPHATPTQAPAQGVQAALDAGSTDVSQPGTSAATPASVAQSTPNAVSSVTVDRALTVGVDPALPAFLSAPATKLRDDLARALDARVTGGSADLVIGAVDPTSTAPALPIVTIDYVAVVSRRLLVREVTFEQLRALWDGAISDWAAVGSPVSHGVVRVTLNGSSGPFPMEKAAGDFASLDELAAFVRAERGALAIVPLDEIDFRFRTLNLDGINYLRPGDAANPLRVALAAQARGSVDPAVLDRARAALQADAGGPAPLSMTWAGDIIIARQVHRRILETGDWAAPFRSIYPELTWADLTISNLETSLSDNYETILDPTTFTFKTDTPAVEGLQLAQIDILSRANNHSFNYGAGGMNDTSAVLDAAGIKHFGMGNNLAEARRPVVVERDGVSFAFLGYNGISDDWDGATPESPGTAPLVDWMVVEDIQREVAAGRVVIPFFHWGTEYVYDPNEEQRYFAHIAIDAGAAMVMGSHPHWVQAVETYKGKPIVYSLGNFVFDQEWSLETKQGMIAHVWMRAGKVLKLDLVPILIEDYHKPRLMTNAEAWPVLEHIWSASDWIVANG